MDLKTFLEAFLEGWCYGLLHIPKGDVRIRYYEKMYEEVKNGSIYNFKITK